MASDAARRATPRADRQDRFPLPSPPSPTRRHLAAVLLLGLLVLTSTLGAVGALSLTGGPAVPASLAALPHGPFQPLGPAHALVSSAASSPRGNLPLAVSMGASPNRGPGGTVVTFSGGGWTYPGAVPVTWSPGGTLTTACTGTVSLSGGFSCTYTLPTVEPGGAYTFTGRQGAASASAIYTITSMLVPSQPSGPVATYLVLTGSSFGSSVPYTITWPRGTVCAGTTDAQGGLACALAIPPAGHYTYSFTANDSQGNSASANFTVTAALSVSPSSGPVGSSVTLTGTGYNGSLPVTVSWPLSPSACSIAADTHGGFNCTYRIPAAGAYVYTLTGNDTAKPVNSASTTFQVTASLYVTPASGIVGSPGTVTGTGFTSGDGVTTTWTDSLGNKAWFCAATVGNFGGFSCTGRFSLGAWGTGSLAAVDTNSVGATAAFQIIPSLSASPSGGPVGTNVALSGSGWYAGDGGSVVFGPNDTNACQFTTDSIGNFTCPVFSIPVLAAGAYYFHASDAQSGNGLTAAMPFAITTNLACSLATSLGPSETTDVGMGVVFTGSVSGGTSPYRVAWSFGDGATSHYLSPTHVYNASGVYSVYAQVTDSYGDVAFAHVDITVNADPRVSTPAASSASADVNQWAVLSTAASGGTGPLTYAWSGLPSSGCTGTSTASVNCTFTSPARLSVSVMVSDAVGATSPSGGNLTFWVYADPVPATPLASLASPDVGQSVSIWTSVAGGSGGLAFRWSGLPPGCSQGSSVQESCVLTTAGTYSVSVAVQDSNGVSGTSPSALSLVVGSALWVGTPMATTADLDVGQSTTVSVMSSTGATLLWAGVPAGCTASGASFACSPNAAGTWMTSVTATDASGSSVSSAPIMITVSPALGTPEVTAGRGALDVGQSVALSVQVSGGTGIFTYLWSGLPPGCAAANGPALGCSPTSTGTYSVNVNVTDSNGAATHTDRAAQLTVSATLLVAAPSLSVSSVQSGKPVLISSSSSGGAAPIAWTWSGLPSGCTATGASFSCSPSAVGTYTISVAVSDANGAWASSAPVTLTVTAVPTPTPAPSFAQGATGLDWTMFLLLVILVLVSLAALVAARGSRSRAPSRPRPARPLKPAAEASSSPAAEEPSPVKEEPHSTPTVEPSPTGGSERADAEKDSQETEGPSSEEGAREEWDERGPSTKSE